MEELKPAKVQNLKYGVYRKNRGLYNRWVTIIAKGIVVRFTIPNKKPLRRGTHGMNRRTAAVFQQGR